VISYVGDSVALTALLLWVESTVGVGVAVSALLLVNAVPNGLLGPVAGAFADRVDQRTLMIATDVGRSAVFILIAATTPSFVVLLVLMGFVAILEAIFRPAGRSAIPALVGRDDLMTANAWLVSALNAGFAVGPLLGGVLVAAIGVSGALYVNAGSFLLSAALLVGLPHLRSDDVEEDRLGFLATIREGLAFARKDRMMRAILLGLLLGVTAAALDNVALVFMATRVFDAGPAGFGLLDAAFGIGMITASLVLVRKQPLSAAALFALGWVGTAVGNFGVGLAPAIYLAVVAQFVGGGGNGMCIVGSDTLIQRTVPKPMLGRAAGIAGSAPFLGMLVAYAVGGILVDTVGARATYFISGTATAVVAVFVWGLFRGAES